MKTNWSHKLFKNFNIIRLTSMYNNREYIYEKMLKNIYTKKSNVSSNLKSSNSSNKPPIEFE